MEYEVGENELVSTAVVRAVSTVDGQEPSSLPLLSGVVDPDALNRLFGPTFAGESRPGGLVRFVYDHYFVTVENGEYIMVEPVGNGPQLFDGVDGDAGSR